MTSYSSATDSDAVLETLVVVAVAGRCRRTVSMTRRARPISVLAGVISWTSTRLPHEFDTPALQLFGLTPSDTRHLITELLLTPATSLPAIVDVISSTSLDLDYLYSWSKSKPPPGLHIYLLPHRPDIWPHRQVRQRRQGKAFMPFHAPCGACRPVVPIGIKIGLFVFKYHVHITALAT